MQVASTALAQRVVDFLKESGRLPSITEASDILPIPMGVYYYLQTPSGSVRFGVMERADGGCVVDDIEVHANGNIVGPAQHILSETKCSHVSRKFVLSFNAKANAEVYERLREELENELTSSFSP